MKILYVGVSNNLGGIETFVINTFRQIEHRDIQVDFLKYSSSICFEDEIIKNGSKTFQLSARGLHFFKHYLELIKFFRKNKGYDIVHYHLNTASCIAALVVAKIYGIKTIAHSHNEYKGNSFVSSFLHKLNKKILPLFTDGYLACSDLAGRDMFGKRRFTIVNNGIDTLNFAYDEDVRSCVRSEFNIKNEVLVGHIGAFKYQKNHAFLIDIFSEYHKINPNSKLMLVGDGDLRLEIEAKVVSLELSKYVIFTGLRYDISSLLQAMDLFLLPSYYEGLPIVTVEAQSSGLQLFITDVISSQTQLTNLIHYLSIKQSSQEWAEIIDSKFKTVNRQGYNLEVKNKGFDSKTSVESLESLYLNLTR